MKQYKTQDYTFIIQNETEKIFAIIAYVAISHDNETKPTFAVYESLYKPRWSSEFIELQSGEIRWDGVTTAKQCHSIIHQHLDDLLMKIAVEFMTYEIASKYIFRDIPLKVDLSLLYYTLKQHEQYAPPILEVLNVKDLKADYLLKKNPKIQKKCINTSKELIEMSTKVLLEVKQKEDLHDKT